MTGIGCEVPFCLPLTRREAQSPPRTFSFLITPTRCGQHPHAQLPISSLSNQSHPSSLPSPITSPACRCTSQGSTGEPETSGKQADSVFQELPKSCGVLSGTPTGDLQPRQSHIHTLAHVHPSERTAYTQVSIHLPMYTHAHTPTEHKYMPDTQTAKGISTDTFKHIQLQMCVHTHTHHVQQAPNGLEATHCPTLSTHPSSSCQKEINRDTINRTSPHQDFLFPSPRAVPPNSFALPLFPGGK